MLNITEGSPLAVQWLELHAATANCAGSIPGWETKILQVSWHGQRKGVTWAPCPLLRVP